MTVSTWLIRQYTTFIYLVCLPILMSPTYQLNCLLNKTWFYNLKVFFIFPGTVGLTMLVFFCFQTSLYLISTKNWKDWPNLWVLCTFHHAFKWPKKKKKIKILAHRLTLPSCFKWKLNFQLFNLRSSWNIEK